ncbi:hypothetical protein I4F81_009822 [Pyropia yezoensis]|uniref:Uncharacterized protein n=1 Tax=Pyropia yezoensis TaxID=2788 RepID=A0ACC3CAQ9_PYRYE|nr:hypothetical protein I4F81_009822 [Neopyropia yezoensis]
MVTTSLAAAAEAWLMERRTRLGSPRRRASRQAASDAGAAFAAGGGRASGRTARECPPPPWPDAIRGRCGGASWAVAGATAREGAPRTATRRGAGILVLRRLAGGGEGCDGGGGGGGGESQDV